MGSRLLSEVIRDRQNAIAGGCCNRFADNQGCDCMALAVKNCNVCDICRGSGHRWVKGMSLARRKCLSCDGAGVIFLSKKESRMPKKVTQCAVWIVIGENGGYEVGKDKATALQKFAYTDKEGPRRLMKIVLSLPCDEPLVFTATLPSSDNDPIELIMQEEER